MASSTIPTAFVDEAAIEEGEFYYLVKIPVGGRTEPNIMSKRSGRGFKRHTIVVGVRRITPKDSVTTYIELKDYPNEFVFEKTMDGQIVLQPFENPPALHNVCREYYLVKPKAEAANVWSQPTISSSVLMARTAGTIVESSESFRETPESPIFVKLRHTEGWMEKSDLSLITEEGPSRDESTAYYTVTCAAVASRVAPDIEAPRVPNARVKTQGMMVTSNLRYRPPCSAITFVKLDHEIGWIFDKTQDGEVVLTEIKKTDDASPTQVDGPFYYQTKSRVPILDTPSTTTDDDSSSIIESTSSFVQWLEKSKIFAAEIKLEVTQGSSKVVFLRIRGGDSTSNWVLEDPAALRAVDEDTYNVYITPPSWLDIGFPTRKWFKLEAEEGTPAMAEEMLLQQRVMEGRNVLGTSSQGRDGIPIKRKGYLRLPENNNIDIVVSLEEIKHPASNVFFTFQWKQLWWIFEIGGVKHSVECQHGLRGGFRSLLYDGVEVESRRPVAGVFWDSGSEFEFTRDGHTFKVMIELEGSFFSTSSQYFIYTLQVDGNPICCK